MSFIGTKSTLIKKSKIRIKGQETFKEMAGYVKLILRPDGTIQMGSVEAFQNINLVGDNDFRFSPTEQEFIAEFEAIHEADPSLEEYTTLRNKYANILPKDLTAEELSMVQSFSTTWAVAVVEWAYQDLGTDILPVHVHTTSETIADLEQYDNPKTQILELVTRYSAFTPSRKDIEELPKPTASQAGNCKRGLIVNVHLGDLGWVMYGIDVSKSTEITDDTEVTLYYGNGSMRTVKVDELKN